MFCVSSPIPCVAHVVRVVEALGLQGPVDLTGFSFGGRVAMGVAAELPHLVRRLVLTGVPADRDALGRLIIKSWKSSLEKGHLEAFAWNSMLQCMYCNLCNIGEVCTDLYFLYIHTQITATTNE